MRCSLYGKLMSKRDFVAVAMPRAFLDLWEPWLQAAVSVSRDRLGPNWQSAFLTAPIWRFWLGADLCGQAVLGAVMPSLDGVGRYFPLTLFACAEDGSTIAPPELDAQEAWFEGAERLLIATLDSATSFDAITAALDALPAPQAMAEQGAMAPQPLADIGALRETLAELRVQHPDHIHGSTSCWWTAGGENFAPMVVTARRMPDPALYIAMLTGSSEARGAP